MNRLFDFGFKTKELWRSEEMGLVRLLIPAESAHETVVALGEEVGLLQFKDLNTDKSAFQRTFANQVKRCDEMARRLRFFADQVAKEGITPAAHVTTHSSASSGSGGAHPTQELDELESRLEELERELLSLNESTERLDRTYYELVELELTCSLEAVTGQVDKVSRVGFVAGTLASDKVPAFERLLFRATRGNVFLRQGSVGTVRDPVSNETVAKHVFVVFFAGDRSRIKIMKICEAFGANRYPFPDDEARQRSMRVEVAGRVRELQTTVEAGARHRRALLQTLAASLEAWSTQVRREKAVYHTLNKMNVDVTSKVLVAEAWVPLAAQGEVARALRHSAASSSTQLHVVMQSVSSPDTPPTYFRTSRFSAAFQGIVEAYGVARYREVNPAVLTLMTFPFLFAVMFGDFGHAIIMIAFAAVLVWKEKELGRQTLGDILQMLYGGRYIILMMGIYSFYLGLIYNEFFSMPVIIFGRTKFKSWCTGGCTAAGVLKMPPGSAPVVFGMDPIWHGRKTELSYFNSIKMKMSILLGVTHMNFGILNSLYNNLFFRDYLSIWAEFVPQMIFLNSIFGYLCVLIVIKWCTGKLTDLYHVMIYMFLSPGGGFDDPSQILIAGQPGLQVFLLLVAFVAVPWMLLPKPLILKKRHDALQAAAAHAVRLWGAVAHGGGGGDGHGGDGHGGRFDFGEIMVHQVCVCVCVCVCVYPSPLPCSRHLPLGLHHTAMSQCIWVLMAAIASGNIAAMIIGFFVFACGTLGVLMVMESLSAFLLALRLHWVEYQGKFYKGDGYKFMPFNFANLKQLEDAGAL
eukprot:XP_001698738.1 predicted protein [Chlamydomonas reinhardtii]